jgi:hypothetical protein
MKRHRQSSPPDQPRSTHEQRRMSRDLRATVCCEPDAAGSYLSRARRHNRPSTRPTAGGEVLSLETGFLVEGAAAAQVARLAKGVSARGPFVVRQAVLT